MRKETAIRFIAEIKANYRYTYRDMSEAEMRVMAERWYDCLKSYTDEQAERAFKAALCKCSVPPTIADMIGILSRQESREEGSDLQLWQEVRRGVGEICQSVWTAKSGFIGLWELRGDGARSVYAKLPPVVRSWLDFDSFCDMGGMTEEELVYERARFLKAIPEVREAAREEKLAGGKEKKITQGEVRYAIGESVG